jgi:hypothetical protein
VATVVWLVTGALVGLWYGRLLWRFVRSVRAGLPGRTWISTWRGLVLRVAPVAVLVVGLFAHSPLAGVWGLMGFLVARSLLCGWVGRGTGGSSWPIRCVVSDPALTASRTDDPLSRRKAG